MTELTFERRDNHNLLLLDEDGKEFKLPVDEALLAEVRLIVQQQRGVNKVRPAEIQKLLRRGHSQSEVAAQTGYDIEDVERFARPVLAELDYIIKQAHEVPVRTSPKQGDTGEKFGEVIDARLETMAAEGTAWHCWKEEEKGWQVAVEFTSYGANHRAVWSFDSVKHILTPETADAVNLSKQQAPEGVIPKPRPLPETQSVPAAASTATEDAPATVTEFPDFGADSTYSAQHDVDFTLPGEEREDNLGETANLLEALRQRRSEREQERSYSPENSLGEVLNPPIWDAEEPAANTGNNTAAAISEGDFAGDNWDQPGFNDTAQYEPLSTATQGASETTPEPKPPVNEKSKKRGRTSIPSWDEILFGTRSEDDPAS